MDLSFLVIQGLSGLASASALFVIASGLTIVFGVTRIVNFAHGSFYMLGAYMAVTIVPWLLEFDRSPALFFLGVFLSAAVVGVIGVIMEVVLLRRIYKVPELFQLLATFGVVLIVQDVVLKVDTQGARTIRTIVPHGIYIFIAPPSIDALAQRLYSRKADSHEAMMRRLRTAQRELESVESFDYVVFNESDREDETVGQILAILTAEQRRMHQNTVEL